MPTKAKVRRSLDVCTRFGLDKVDLLSIDVEGNDPDAMFGVKLLLSKTYDSQE